MQPTVKESTIMHKDGFVYVSMLWTDGVLQIVKIDPALVTLETGEFNKALSTYRAF